MLSDIDNYLKIFHKRKVHGIVAWNNKSTQRKQISQDEIAEINIDSEKDEEKNYSYQKEHNKRKLNNKGLRFSQYSFRKDVVKTEVFPVISSREEGNQIRLKKNNAIDFKKITKRNINEILGVNSNPSAGTYNPKYSFIFKNSGILNPDKNDEYKKKKLKLLKIWRSYHDIGIDYQTVNL